jgi:hypothetical protein
MTPETRINGNQVDVVLGPGSPGLVPSPLVRADVTRLGRSLHWSSPREDRRPLRNLPLPAKNRLDAGSPGLGMKSLGEDVCELLRGADLNQTQVSILDSFMSKMLADVDVLRTFSASNGVVAPLNAGIVILVDWGPGFGSKPHIPRDSRRERDRRQITSRAALDAE